MFSINRSAIMLIPKEPFHQWLESLPDAPGNTLEQLREEEHTIYLVNDIEDSSEKAIDKLLRRDELFADLFFAELMAWYTDPSYYPVEVTLEMFKEWFEIKVHSMVVDTSDDDIEGDEMD